MRVLRQFVFVTFFGLLIVLCNGCDKGTPSASRFDFEIEKAWELTQVDGDEILRPAEPRVTDDGTLYFHDFEKHVSYIIDGSGNLINRFASRGDQEGEVSMYLNCFPAGSQVAVCSMDKLYFYSDQGEFVKAVPNNPFVRFPLMFKNENEFWAAPGALGDAPGETASLTYINLETGEENTVYEFALTDDESKPSGGAMILGLTPQAKIDFDHATNKGFFGKNTDSLVYCINGDNVVIDSFYFSGIRHPVSDSAKREHFAGHDIPEEAIAQIVGSLPDQMTYYTQIRVIDGLVYLISPKSLSGNQTALDVKLFSQDGQYLYYGEIGIEEGWFIKSPDNMQLFSGAMYVIQENESGVKKVVKYNVMMPKS